MYMPSTKLWAATGLIMLLSSCSSLPQKDEPEPSAPKQSKPVPQRIRITPPPPPPPISTPPEVVGIPVETPTPPVSTPIITPPVSELPPEPTHGSRDYHIVLLGDTLSSLAKHYNCSEDDIKTWNGLQAQPLSMGQRLRVSPPDSAPSTETVYHMVEFSETLSAISQRYGHSMAELARWNNLKPPYKVEAGQKLRVAPPTPEQDSGDTTPVVLPDLHLVKLGESLQNIAEMYGVPLTDLAKWNGIGSPYTIYPGLPLKLAPR
ncbi:MAG: LysM peptidoglycan-binding domain-containing protein [Pseudomonadota bacterium]